MEKVKKIPVKQGDKVTTYVINHETGSFEYTLKEPTFKELSLALQALISSSGRVNIADAGKIIWDTCVTEFDKEIEENPRILVSACIKLAEEYVADTAADIKKK